MAGGSTGRKVVWIKFMGKFENREDAVKKMKTLKPPSNYKFSVPKRRVKGYYRIRSARTVTIFDF